MSRASRARRSYIKIGQGLHDLAGSSIGWTGSRSNTVTRRPRPADLPPNARLELYVPHICVLQRASLVVSARVSASSRKPSTTQFR